MLGRLKLRLWRWWGDRVLFNLAVRERGCRQEFFYNAFRALKFNGIAGDYLEFGCWGGRTFALAYHEACRHGHGVRFWAFDSFEVCRRPKTPRTTIRFGYKARWRFRSTVSTGPALPTASRALPIQRSRVSMTGACLLWRAPMRPSIWRWSTSTATFTPAP